MHTLGPPCRNYTRILDTFTEDQDATVPHRIETEVEFDAPPKDETFNNAGEVQLLELIILPEDAPAPLVDEFGGGVTSKDWNP